MTTWTRDRIERHCGLCGQVIPVGDVFQRITFGGWKARKFRCQACAGTTAPADLPAEIVHEAPLPPPADFTRIGLLPPSFDRIRDFKRRQSGEEG